MSFINVWNISSNSKIDYKLEIDLRILYIISYLFGCTLFSHGILDVWCSWKNVLFRIKMWLIWHPAYNRLLLYFLKNYIGKQKQHIHTRSHNLLGQKTLSSRSLRPLFKKKIIDQTSKIFFPFLALGRPRSSTICSYL